MLTASIELSQLRSMPPVNIETVCRRRSALGREAWAHDLVKGEICRRAGRRIGKGNPVDVKSDGPEN